MNIKPIAVAAFALIGVFSLSAHADAPVATNQIAASFDRLLSHSSVNTAVAVPVAFRAEADPLRKHLSVVLWDEPSYHLPVQYAYLVIQPKVKR